MKHIEAENYVIKNAHYVEDAPKNSQYFVRFPSQYSTLMFMSDDTLDLVEQIFKFGRTDRGGKCGTEFLKVVI